MLNRRVLPVFLLCGTLGIAAAAAAQTARPATKPYTPTVGQAGKDVVWVPTAQGLVDKMLDLAKVTPQDYVIDLGSGDGRTVITAARRGARAHGIEYNPEMVALARQAASKAGVSGRATFEVADIFASDFSRAQIITMFLLPDLNLKLRLTLLKLKPGTRIVSNSFNMGDWEPDEQATVTQACENWCTALLWIVPADVTGRWDTPQGPLTLTQQYQKIEGTLGTRLIADGRLRGAEVTFRVGSVRYTGRVEGASMRGTVTGGGQWTATKR